MGDWWGGSSSGGGSSSWWGSSGGGGTTSTRRKKKEPEELVGRARAFAPARRLGQEHDEGEGFSIGGLLGNLGHDVADTLTGLPTGIVNIGRAIGHDITDPTSGKTGLWSEVAEPIARSYAETYGPLVEGDVGQFGENVYQHPLGPILDVATLVSGGAAAAARAGRVGALAGAGRRYASWYDRPRMLTHAPDTSEGVTVPGRPFRSIQGRVWSSLVDAIGGTDRLQYAPFVGVGRRASRRIAGRLYGRRAEYLTMRNRFESAVTRLNKDERFALHLTVANSDPAAVFRSAWNTYTHEVPGPEGPTHPYAGQPLRKYMERLAGKDFRTISREIAEGTDPMAGSKIARLVSSQPRGVFLRAHELARGMDELSGDVLEEAGMLTPEAREARRWLDRNLHEEGMRHYAAGEQGAAYQRPGETAAVDRPALKRARKQAQRDIKRASRQARASQAEASRLHRQRDELEARRAELERDTALKEVDEAQTALNEASEALQEARGRFYSPLEGPEVAPAQERVRAATGEMRKLDDEIMRLRKRGMRAVERAMEADRRYQSGVEAIRRSGARIDPYRLERARDSRMAEYEDVIAKGRELTARRRAMAEALPVAEAERDRAVRILEQAREREARYAESERRVGRLGREHSRAISRRMQVERSLEQVDRRLRGLEDRMVRPAARFGEAADEAERAGAELGVAEAGLERPSGFVGGRDPAELRAEREAQIEAFQRGEETGAAVHPAFGQPFRFPHRRGQAVEEQFTPQTRKAPVKRVKPPAQTKKNRGVLSLTQRFLKDPSILSRDFLSTMGVQLALDYRQYLLRFASDLVPEAGGLGDPARYAYIWTGEVRRTDPAIAPRLREADVRQRDIVGTEREATPQQIERLAHELVWRKEDAYKAFEIEGKTVEQLKAMGVRRVPMFHAKGFWRETGRSNSVMRRFFDKPTEIWRAIVLQYRPAWLVNNIVGQHLLYALSTDPVNGMRYYTRALSRTRDIRPEEMTRLERLLRSRSKYRPLVEEFAPGALFGGFAHAELGNVNAVYLGEGRVGRFAEETLSGERGGRVTRWPLKTVNVTLKAVLGFGRLMSNANLRLADDLPRMAEFLKEAERDVSIKRVRAQLRTMDKANSSLEDALRVMKRDDPDELRATLERVVDQVDASLGNFADLTPFERNYMRRILPFYSWFKVITRVTGRLGFEHPTRLRLLELMTQAAGAEGTDLLEIPAGPMTSFLRAAIPFGGEEDGEQTLVSTMALNPFQTPVQIAGMARAIAPLVREGEVTGQENPLLQTHPAVQALFAAGGYDPFYGGKYLGPGSKRGPAASAAGYFWGLPQFRLLEQLGLVSTGYESTLYDTKARTAGIPNPLWNYLGLPVKRVRLKEARARARAGQ